MNTILEKSQKRLYARRNCFFGNIVDGNSYLSVCNNLHKHKCIRYMQWTTVMTPKSIQHNFQCWRVGHRRALKDKFTRYFRLMFLCYILPTIWNSKTASSGLLLQYIRPAKLEPASLSHWLTDAHLILLSDSSPVSSLNNTISSTAIVMMEIQFVWVLL